MSLTETIIAGTLQPDGTLVLDEKPALPAGWVTVRLKSANVPPGTDSFLQRMQAMWAIPLTGELATDGGAKSLEEVLRLRQEWDEYQSAREQTQESDRSSISSGEELQS